MPCKPGESAKPPKTSRPSLPGAQALRGPFRKGSAPWEYAARAPLGKNARIYTMWPQRQPSMSFVSCVG